MRSFVVLLMLIFIFSACSKDDKIIIHIKTDIADVKEYVYYQSIDNNFLEGHKNTAYLNWKNEDVLKLDSDNRSVRIVYQDRVAQLYLSPGDEVVLDFNVLDKQNAYIAFEGDNAAGHFLYNELIGGRQSLDFMDIGIEAFKKSKSYDKALELILTQEKLELDKLVFLLKEGKISRDYYEMCKSSIQIYYRLADTYVFYKDGENWYNNRFDVIKSIR